MRQKVSELQPIFLQAIRIDSLDWILYSISSYFSEPLLIDHAVTNNCHDKK